DQAIHGPADVRRVLSLARRASFHEKRDACQTGHRSRVFSGSEPAAILLLLFGQPFQTLLDGGAIRGRDLAGAPRGDGGQKPEESKGKTSAHGWLLQSDISAVGNGLRAVP